MARPISPDPLDPRRAAAEQFRRQQAADRSRDHEAAQPLVAEADAGRFVKGLDPTQIPAALQALSTAVASERQSDFDAIPLGGVRKLVNPQAGFAFELSGNDPQGYTMPPPPSQSSREAAAELIELYEMALLHDRSFAVINEGGAHPDADRAVAVLNAFGSDFKGPKNSSGQVSRKLLFRGKGPGEAVGPYVSQFLLHDVHFGAHSIRQKYDVIKGDYGITQSEFDAIQAGNVPRPQVKTTDTDFTYSPRLLAAVVKDDFVYQQFLYAALICLQYGLPRQPAFAALTKEGAFITNGGPAEIGCAVTEVARHALKAAWVQKWQRHLRQRPEAMAGLVVDGNSLIHSDLQGLGGDTLAAVSAQNQASGGEAKPFLPLPYAEGSPLHPSYPAGHATIAGACVTLLKLFFADAPWHVAFAASGDREALEIVESTDGKRPTPYTGADGSQCTVHGELNKLASNVATGRNMAGIHYRSDGDLGLLLGEKVALQYFQDLQAMGREVVGPVTIKGFDGSVLIA
jgi:hypothetical protein